MNYRWLGGMLTNFQTVHARVAKLRELERLVATGETEQMIKKEGLKVKREVAKLERNLGGIRNLEQAPDAVFVIDTKKEHIAVTEANRLGIPVVAVVDTNCDPDVIDFVIPGNDDAIRSANLMCRIVADAVDRGPVAAVAQAGAAGHRRPTRRSRRRRRRSRSRPRSRRPRHAEQQTGPRRRRRRPARARGAARRGRSGRRSRADGRAAEPPRADAPSRTARAADAPTRRTRAGALTEDPGERHDG